MSSIRVALSVALLALCGCSNAPAAGDCDKLLTHVVDLELNGAKVEGSVRDEQGTALRTNVGERFVARCNAELPAKQVRCGLKAATREALASCDK